MLSGKRCSHLAVNEQYRQVRTWMVSQCDSARMGGHLIIDGHRCDQSVATSHDVTQVTTRIIPAYVGTRGGGLSTPEPFSCAESLIPELPYYLRRVTAGTTLCSLVTQPLSLVSSLRLPVGL